MIQWGWVYQETDNVGHPSNALVEKTTNKNQVHDRTVINDPKQNIFWVTKLLFQCLKPEKPVGEEVTTQLLEKIWKEGKLLLSYPGY